jgi:hypothetical protein
MVLTMRLVPSDPALVIPVWMSVEPVQPPGDDGPVGAGAGQGKQFGKVLLRVPGREDLGSDRAEGGQVVDHRIEAARVHTGSRAGQPVA